MKKLVLVSMIFILVCGSAFAFVFDPLLLPDPVEAGDFIFDIGVGFGAFGGPGWNMSIPPIGASLTYFLPVEVPVSVGGMFAFMQYRWGTLHAWTGTFLVFAARANWHFNVGVENLDLYAGFSLGYQHFTTNDQHIPWRLSSPYFAGQIGARYFFTGNLAAAVELGHPMWIRAGVAFKF